MKPSSRRDSRVHYTTFSTPLGRMLAAERGGKLRRLEFIGRKNPASILKRSAGPNGAEFVKGNTPILERARNQMGAYFDGSLKKFDLPLKLEGTDFQKKVWRRLTGIPHGATTNYGEIALRVGRPKGSRAAGAAVGSNPIAIAVPCHRVLGKSGDLTGYGGGLWRKKWLLEHEGSLS